MRRKRFSALLICFFFVTLLLQATPLQMGFLSVVDDDIATTFPQQLFSLISQRLATLPFSTQYYELINQRILQKEERDRLEKMDVAINKSDGHVAQSEVVPSPPLKLTDMIDVTWKQISPAISLSKAAAREDRTIINYLLNFYNLDSLIICRIEHFDVFYRVRLIFHNPTSEVLYDGIAKPEELAHLMQEAFLAVISNLSHQELALLTFDWPTPGASVYIDGQLAISYGGFFPLERGSHLVSVRAPNFIEVEKSISVEPGELLALEFPMEQVVGPPVLITSDGNNPLITITHGPSGNVPLIWHAQETPFVLFAYQDGMRPAIRHFNKPIEQIELTLQPPWMDGVKIITRSQKHLYASLGRTILLGAAAIIIDSISRSYSSNALWQPMVWGTLSAMAVSSIETGVQLFAYYQKTKYSSQ